MRKSILVAVVPIAALLAAACGSSSKTTTTHAKGSTSTTSASSSSSRAEKVTISTRTVKPFGVILTNSAGHTLYIFEPDKKKHKVSCVAACAAVWPPVKVPSSGKAVAVGAVSTSLLGYLPNPSGGRVLTYNGWPLYAYVRDTSPGVAHGQGVKLNGGVWYAMSPSGNVIKRKASSSSSSGYKY